jgi:Rieske [2Fe-2S] domain
MRLISQLERAEALDRVVTLGQRAARCLRPGRLRDGLHGVWLGHPLHPVLVQAPVGAWMSTAVLDARLGSEASARRLVAFGLAAVSAGGLLGGHMSGPLSDSDLEDGCLTCPWHGSEFRISDGSVARGPATAPQPVFETRVQDGVAGHSGRVRGRSRTAAA